MKIHALQRFNHHDPGDEFEAPDEDAKKWIGNGLAEPAGMSKAPDPDPDSGPGPEKKEAKGPAKDKLAKGGKTK